MARKTATKSKAGLSYYEAADGFRWQLRAGNGNLVAESGEGYRRIDGARKGFRAVIAAINELEGFPQDAKPVTPRAARKKKAPAMDDVANSANADLNRQDSLAGAFDNFVGALADDATRAR
jgi:uncharacterized protein YegP (UPF0339 family)